MSYVTLERAKKFCRIEINDDDEMVALMIDAAESHVAKFLGQGLENYLIDNGDSLPDLDRPLDPAIELCVCLYTNDAYRNREVQVIGTIVAENPTATNILYWYKSGLGV